MLWLPAGVPITVLLWLNPHVTPKPSSAHPSQAPAKIVLSPSLQPAYTQWFPLEMYTLMQSPLSGDLCTQMLHCPAYP